MSVKVVVCGWYGMSPPIGGVLLHATIKLFANIMIGNALSALAQRALIYGPNELPFPIILPLTVVLLILDTAFIISLICGGGWKTTPLLEIYFRYELRYVGMIVLHGIMWVLYLLTRTKPGENTENLFIMTGMATGYSLLFHAFFATLLRLVVPERIPGSQPDLRIASQDLTDGYKNKMQEIDAGAFNYV